MSSALSIAGLKTHPDPNEMESTINWFRDEPGYYETHILRNSYVECSRPGLDSSAVSPPSLVDVSTPMKTIVPSETSTSSQFMSSYMPKYKMFADSLSLHIETENIGLANLCDVLPLDSDSSILKI
jgi:hypothetical protein